VLYNFEHRRIEEFLDKLNNPISGDNVKDTRDGDRRVPRDKIQGRRLSKAHPLAWFDGLVVFERKLDINHSKGTEIGEEPQRPQIRDREPRDSIGKTVLSVIDESEVPHMGPEIWVR
jgi:hypothetical protein